MYSNIKTWKDCYQRGKTDAKDNNLILESELKAIAIDDLVLNYEVFAKTSKIVAKHSCEPVF